MDPLDFDLLRRIAAGERFFKGQEGQAYEEFEDAVLRLLRLRDQYLITMKPEPHRSSRGARREYTKTGVCELTADGRDAVERHRP